MIFESSTNGASILGDFDAASNRSEQMTARDRWQRCERVLAALTIAIALVAPMARAQSADLNLIPQPQEAKETSGGAFRVTPRTRIIVSRGLGGANFEAAQMLAEEIEGWTGWKLKISEGSTAPGGSDFIYIGNVSDDSRLRAALEAQGLKMPQGFDEQGYAIGSDSHRILIGGASAQGAFYGVQSLRQLLRSAKNQNTSQAKVDDLECPAVAIRDWPAMKWRGVHVDLSRGPILSLDYMKQQIRILSAYKINMYALYMEDVFALPDEPISAPQRGALTPEEMRDLVAYAKPYFVTIVPELETFGHLHNVLRYDIYSQLAEMPHGAVLTPTQAGTYDFLGKMIANIAPSFPGSFFHIGADETSQLGEGQTKQLIAEKGAGQVYLDHIVKLDEILKAYHKQTMFWADIAEHFPQLLPTLPKDLIAVVWEYGAQPDYDKRLEPFKNAGLPIFVSPGVSDWSQIYPDYNTAYQNIRNLTRDGQKFGALGMLNTEWNDYGERLSGLLWPGFVFGAACAWQPGESSVDSFKASYDWAFYRNSDHTFADALEKLSATNTLLAGMKMGSALDSYFWEDTFSKSGANDAQTAQPVAHELRVDAEQAWASLIENRAKARLHGDSLDDAIFAARRLDALGMKFEYTAEIGGSYWDAFLNMSDRGRVERDLEGISSTNGELQDLREAVTELRASYEQRWRAENRDFWLGNVLVRYDTLAEGIQSKIQAVDMLEGEFERGEALPAPESLGFAAGRGSAEAVARRSRFPATHCGEETLGRPVVRLARQRMEHLEEQGLAATETSALDGVGSQSRDRELRSFRMRFRCTEQWTKCKGRDGRRGRLRRECRLGQRQEHLAPQVHDRSFEVHEDSNGNRDVPRKMRLRIRLRRQPGAR
jgi:hexosaminidase